MPGDQTALLEEGEHDSFNFNKSSDSENLDDGWETPASQGRVCMSQCRARETTVITVGAHGSANIDDRQGEFNL